MPEQEACKHGLWTGGNPCLYCAYEVGLGPVKRMPWDGPARPMTAGEASRLVMTKNCEECGLPIKACNALAMYRIAHRQIERGRVEDAKEAGRSANDWYQKFRAEQPTKQKR